MGNMDALTWNLLITILVLAFVLVQGLYYYRINVTEGQFFLFGRKLTGAEYAVSFSAASVSLATVVFFFVAHAPQLGIYLLFSPLVFVAGCYLYTKLLVPRLAEQGFFKWEKSQAGVPLGRSLANYIDDRFESRYIKNSILLISFLGLSSAFILEMFVGVKIFSIYLEADVEYYALIVISIVVFVYSGFGGLPAAIRTDYPQLAIIALAFVSLCIWLSMEVATVDSTAKLMTGFVPPLPEHWLTLMANAFVVNLCLLPALLRTWQMAAASPNAQAVGRGVMQGALFTTALSLLFIFVGLLLAHVLFPDTAFDQSGGESEYSEEVIVAILERLSDNQSEIARYALFPLLFVGSLAALLSTADSALLPLIHAAYLTVWGRRTREGEPLRYRRVLSICAIALLFEALLYYAVFIRWTIPLVQWLYIIFSLMVVTTPAIVAAVMAPRQFLRSRLGRSGALLSLWAGLATAVFASVLGVSTGSQELVWLNSPLGFLVSATLMYVAFVVYRRGGVEAG